MIKTAKGCQQIATAKGCHYYSDSKGMSIGCDSSVNGSQNDWISSLWTFWQTFYPLQTFCQSLPFLSHPIIIVLQYFCQPFANFLSTFYPLQTFCQSLPFFSHPIIILLQYFSQPFANFLPTFIQPFYPLPTCCLRFAIFCHSLLLCVVLPQSRGRGITDTIRMRHADWRTGGLNEVIGCRNASL